MKKLMIAVSCMAMLLSGCGGISSSSASKNYNQLETRFDSLVDDKITETDRRDLEKDYRKLKKKLDKSDSSPAIQEYKSKVNEKIQYLEDLQD